jgi:hypothetical protein
MSNEIDNLLAGIMGPPPPTPQRVPISNVDRMMENAFGVENHTLAAIKADTVVNPDPKPKPRSTPVLKAKYHHTRYKG